MTHLLTLKCENNLLQSATIDELPYLQTASFAQNKIKSVSGLGHPQLEQINLNGKLMFLTNVTVLTFL